MTRTPTRRAPVRSAPAPRGAHRGTGSGARFGALLAAACIGGAAAAPPAQASPTGRIFLNGVDITGVREQLIKKAEVHIDAAGNIHITAEGYQVQVAGAPTAAPPPPAAAVPPPAPDAPAAPLLAAPDGRPAATAFGASAGARPQAIPPATGLLRNRYWLVGTPVEGDAQYEVDVFVNSRWIARLSSAEAQVVKDVTGALKPGENKVLLMARKTAGQARKSFAEMVKYRVILGVGDAGGDTVMINSTLIEYNRTAAESEDLSHEFTVTAS